ncbi:autophagy-related protein 22-like protein [Auriculariales sp. MPI-PUGE-AT-0066]|nr:autophagy-related protein 22-like protein [Auriculariales sp. MPI-PUGE-AT-0066]
MSEHAAHLRAASSNERQPLVSMSFERQHVRHLRGWLSYQFASEVFAVVSLTLFLPICLEQFARDNGYLASDRAVPCTDRTAPPGGPVDETERCLVKLGWLWIDSASFSLYTFSASVALQALTVISVGAIADQPSQRKPLLLTFAAIGSIATALFLVLSSTSVVWLLCALFAILANISFGTSIVALNAYLPDLAKGSPEVRKAWDKVQSLNTTQVPPAIQEHTRDDEEEPLLAIPDEVEISSTNKDAVDVYNAALLRLAIGASGIWWAIFTIPASYWLPGARSLASKSSDRPSLLTEVRGSWARILDMLRPAEIRKLRNTFWFLAAWFVLSDGFTTITGTAVLFAKTTLHLPASALVGVGVLVPLTGILGSLIWPRIQRAAGWTNLRCMLILVLLASLIPLYGCLGFLSVFHRSPKHGGWRFGGLTTKEEMFILAIYFGSIYGAFQSYARAVFSEIIPRGEEARWFSLYSITDKSSSFLGPLCVGLIADATGNIRFGFFFIVIMMWLAVPVLLTVNVERGRRDARAVSDERDARGIRRLSRAGGSVSRRE